MKENVRFYFCPICGNVIGLIDGNMDHVTCCGRKMELMQANTNDASQEKHVPVYEKVEDELVVKDANGNILKDGDTVTVIKDLKVKGSSSPIKIGTKVKNIRLVDGDHNIDCKIDGFGAMSLKSEFVKKA